MSIDRSLRRKGGLSRSRNVLTRGERILQMKAEDKWTEGQSPIGIPKTRVFKAVVGKKKKAKGPEEKEAAAPAPKGAKPAAAAAAKPAVAAAAKPAAKK